MIRFLSSALVFVFFVMFISGCSTYTIERANVEIKKVPSHTDEKKDEHEHDDEEGPGNSDFGHSHKKEWSKEKYDDKKKDRDEKKKENDD